ncbi:MAG: Uncharacterized protein XD70_0254 [Thermovirga lienii]|nr:MAG: Uncharacterized protein XD70_0254 [Thermovirga lienii]
MLKKFVFMLVLSLHLIVIHHISTAFAEKGPSNKVLFITESNQRTQMATKALMLLLNDPTEKVPFITATLTISPLGSLTYYNILEQIKSQKPTACVFLLKTHQFPSLAKIMEEEEIPSIFPWGGPVEDNLHERAYTFFMNWNEASRFEALGIWAERQNLRKWSLIAERLDATSRALSNEAAKKLLNEGIKDVRTFQINPNDDSNLLNTLKEGRATGHGNILAFLNPMNIIRITTFVQKQGMQDLLITSGWEWEQTPPVEGIHVITQYPLPTEETLSWAKKHFHQDILEHIPLEQLIKAYGAAMWLSQALSLPTSTPLDVARNLERTGALNVLGYELEVSSKTHLPLEQTFSLLKRSRGKWILEGKITLEKRQ